MAQSLVASWLAASTPSSYKYFPASQSVHNVDPDVEVDPKGQILHAVSKAWDDATSAKSFKYFPAPHAVHVVVPCADHSPAAQIRHVDEDA